MTEPGPRFVKLGDSFERITRLDAGAIRDFANASGDTNPLHHDEALAARSRFGCLIASGTHTASLLLSLSAAHFSALGAAVGLDFRLQFKKAARAGDTLTVRWTVTDAAWKDSLGGKVVGMDGIIVNQNGETVLLARGVVLVAETL